MYKYNNTDPPSDAQFLAWCEENKWEMTRHVILGNMWYGYKGTLQAMRTIKLYDIYYNTLTCEKEQVQGMLHLTPESFQKLDPIEVHPLQHLFVPPDIAKQVFLLGFDEPCFAYYQLSGSSEEYVFQIVGEYQHNIRDWFTNYVGTGLTNTEMQRNPVGRMNDCMTAPLISQVIDWFEQYHGIHISSSLQWKKRRYGFHIWKYADADKSYMHDLLEESHDLYDTSRESKIHGIKSAIRIVNRVITSNEQKSKQSNE